MRCLVLHPDIRHNARRRNPQNALSEAVALGAALDLEIVASEVVRLNTVRAGVLFGKGKIAEIQKKIEEGEIGLVVIDGPVSPVQQRNLERTWNVKVLDRTGLILEIFANRAATREGVLQVDLAALSYQRSRLVRSWTHLERQRGGLSFVGGAGETQIEADRRAIDDAIVRLKRHLAKVVKTRALHRSARQKVPYPIVALVGYTNAGKSTIFNRLTGAEVMAKDMLFATLDPTMRAIKLPSGRDVILSDTVGFISDLPTELVAAFRATLEEVLDADMIIHVRDISHPQSAEQALDVVRILEGLGVEAHGDTPQLEVLNKIDLVAPEEGAALATSAGRKETRVVCSAITGVGLDDLLDHVETGLQVPTVTEVLRLGFNDGKKRAWLFARNVVTRESNSEAGFEIEVTWTHKQAQQFVHL